MKVFNGLILYVLIGGIMASLFLNSHFKKCNELPSETSVIFLIFAWPVAIPLSILISNDVEKHIQQVSTCDKESK